VSDTKGALLKLIYDSKALSIWNRTTGPVFWYIAGVPGPFYINTEQMIGRDLAEGLLKNIDAILARTKDAATRSQALEELILAAYTKTPVYSEIVAVMVAEAKKSFSAGSYSFVSGGERRDWLFSIPFAREIDIKHAFLFKNLDIHCPDGLRAGETSLHVADLINNAASYFDLWFPALEKAGLKCVGTVCINSRGTHGVDKLKAHGEKVLALNAIELDFFKQSLESGLIDQATYDEIALHFTSPKEWGVKYLIGNAALFDVAHADKKSFERIKSFVEHDPWQLREAHPGFFDDMQAAIEKRPKGAAA